MHLLVQKPSDIDDNADQQLGGRYWLPIDEVPEIVRGVLKNIKPGIFKEILINKDDLLLTELKGFLQTHLREKNRTELFQELMCTKQDDNETAQQFLYCVIGIK